MNTIRKFITGFSDLWQKYQPLNVIRNITTQHIPNLLQKVNPYKKLITTMRKEHDKLQELVAQDNIVQENQNASEQTSNAPNNYEVHEPAKQFKNIAYTYLIKEKLANRFTPPELFEGIVLFMGEYIVKVNSTLYFILNKELEKLSAVKYNIVVKVIYKQPATKSYIGSHVWSSKVDNSTVITNQSEIQPSIHKNFQELQNKIDEFTNNGSGWRVKSIEQLEVNIVKYTPLTGSSYIALPTFIESKKACINVKNEDNRCFAYAVTSQLILLKRIHKGQLNIMILYLN